MACILICCSSAAGAAPLIIDHTCTDIHQIPNEWLQKAKNLTVHYAHTSHGSQVITGLYAWESEDPLRYSVAVRESGEEGLPLAEDLPALMIYDGNPPETYITPELYWDSISGRASTRSVAATGHYSLSMWSWCGQQSDSTYATTQRYLTTMNQFETAFPGMHFIYMTGHTDGSGVSGNLNQRNEQVRQYCINNNKVLFDFADIESFDPDMTAYLDQGVNDNCDYDGGNWADEWLAAHPGSELAEVANPGKCEECAHSQRLNCVLKGAAFWWMMARLAGWEGPATGGGPVAMFSAAPTSGPSPLTVQFTDTSANNPASWNWNFGDGTWFNTTDRSLRSPTHTYNTPNTYTARLTVAGPLGTSTSGGILITVNPLANRWITVTPGSLDLVVESGKKARRELSLTYHDSHPTPATLRFQNLVDAPYLKVTPRTGSLQNGQSRTLIVSINASGIPSGSYLGNITISSITPSGVTPVVVQVNLIVTTVPLMRVIQPGITFSLNTESRRARYLTIRSTGTEELEYSLTCTPEWVTTDPLSGTVAPKGVVRIRVIADTSGITEGDYTGGITITSNDSRYPAGYLVPVAVEVI
ncbi:MAG: PKD domain-containing protein [Methanomicrobiales archaeon]|nr:PKD domain-containing protein [Methanomicrobiales archaeon]